MEPKTKVERGMIDGNKQKIVGEETMRDSVGEETKKIEGGRDKEEIKWERVDGWRQRRQCDRGMIDRDRQAMVGEKTMK